jgi:high-affinity iron transporter
MIAPFVICLREGMEIFLVIIPLALYFNKNKLYNFTKSIVKGGFLGAALATILATVIFSQASLFNGPASDLFDGLLGIVLSLLVLYSVVLLRKTKAIDTTPSKQMLALSQKGIFLIAAITFFRELLEATLFILTSSGSSPILVLLASLSGLLSAALIIYIVAKGFSKLNIKAIFYGLNLFLIGLGAYYFGDGLEVLFGQYVNEIFKIGIMVYAVPSYFLMVKNDLKSFMKTLK